MTRFGIIKQNRIRMSKLNSRLKNIKNYKSNRHLLKDLAKYERAKKEIEIQECYIQLERN